MHRLPARNESVAQNFAKLGFKPGRATAGGVVYEFGKGTACFLNPATVRARKVRKSMRSLGLIGNLLDLAFSNTSRS